MKKKKILSPVCKQLYWVTAFHQDRLKKRVPRSDRRGEALCGGHVGFGEMLIIYPATHGDCTSLERGKLALRTAYELSFILLAANCNFALRLALSKKTNAR